MKGNNVVPHTMQLCILQKENGKYDVIKHIKFADAAKVLHSTILSMCQEGGRACAKTWVDSRSGTKNWYQQALPTSPARTRTISARAFRSSRPMVLMKIQRGAFATWTEEQVNAQGPHYPAAPQVFGRSRLAGQHHQELSKASLRRPSRGGSWFQSSFATFCALPDVQPLGLLQEGEGPALKATHLRLWQPQLGAPPRW